MVGETSFKICPFIQFLAALVFIATLRLFLVAVSGGCSLLQYGSFSLQWLLSLESMGSRTRWAQ